MTNIGRDNPFETPEAAAHWIQQVEGHDDGREIFMYPRLQAFIEQLDPDSELLDVGCGQGVCSEYVPKHMRYIGVDPSAILVARANELYGDEPNSQFLTGEAARIPLKDNSVDAVISVHVWFHLPDLRQAGEELARVVRPGGEIFLTTAHPAGYEIWESWYNNKKIDGIRLSGYLGNDDFSTGESVMYRHSMDEIIGSFVDAGFTEPVVDEFGRYETPTGMALTSTRT